MQKFLFAASTLSDDVISFVQILQPERCKSLLYSKLLFQAEKMDPI